MALLLLLFSTLLLALFRLIGFKLLLKLFDLILRESTLAELELIDVFSMIFDDIHEEIDTILLNVVVHEVVPAEGLILAHALFEGFQHFWVVVELIVRQIHFLKGF